MDLNAISGSPAFTALQAFAPAVAASSSPTPQPADDPSLASPAPTVATGANLYAVSQGIGQALSVVDAASSAGRTVLGLLDQMRQAAVQASETDLSTSARQTLDQTFQAQAGQIASTLQAATVNGMNLVDGSMPGAMKTPLGDGALASVDASDLSPDGSTLSLAGANLTTAQAASAARSGVDVAAGAAAARLETLQAQGEALAGHAFRLQSLGSAGAGAATGEGDDGVRLLALQVAQQLSAQPAPIANAAPQQVLALFR